MKLTRFGRPAINALGPPQLNGSSEGTSLVPWETLSQSLYEQQPTETLHSALVVCDNSQSMYDSGAIVELEKLFPKFLSDLSSDASIRSSVLMTFGHFGEVHPLELAGPLRPVAELAPPQLKPSPLATPLCGCLVKSVAFMLAARKLIRNQLHIAQKKSWVIQFTDGAATDEERHAEARHAIQTVAMENGIEVYLFGVGQDADMKFLHTLEQPGRPAEKLTSEKNFADLFRWLHNSLRIVSQTAPGRGTDLPSVNGALFKTQ